MSTRGAGGEAADTPRDPLLDDIRELIPGVEFSVLESVTDPTDLIVGVAAADLVSFAEAARQAGFTTFIDLCGIDHLSERPRFEVVVILLSIEHRRRLRVHVGVSGTDPVLPSITPLFPGANFFERETWDLFGIVFAGHPDLTRILLPDDWEGHPLRKDYSVGSVPVQFKGAHRAP